MPSAPSLTIPPSLHNQLKAHLFPGDGKEAAALLLCSSSASGRRLIAHDVLCVPHEECAVRERDRLTWPGEWVNRAIDKAETTGDTIIAVHSHPGSLFEFSSADDASDKHLVPSLQQANAAPHGTAIMIPSGSMRARIYSASRKATPLYAVIVPGDDIRIWFHDGASLSGPALPPMAFTSDMTGWLKRLCVCIIGVSGTGSIVAEQLARLGVGKIILIDFDKVEPKNLNRILNSTTADAAAKALKVEMFARSIRAHHADTEVVVVPHPAGTREAVLAASEADFLFSCVDTGEGRHIADRIAAHFAIPLFDVGVSIPTGATTDGTRRIAEVCGRIDYVQPGGSTLKDRGVYDGASLEAEYLRRTAPKRFEERVKEGYIKGFVDEAPSVIVLNMRAAADCAMELIARVFPFRHDPNERYARTIFMLADGDIERFPKSDFEVSDELPVGVGMVEPLLGLPMLAAANADAA